MHSNNTETIIVDYKALGETLEHFDKLDHNRTHSYLDLLYENISRNIENILNTDTVAVDLDHENKTTTIFGEEINGEYRTMLPYNHHQESRKIYYLFTEAILIAKHRGIHDKIFMTIEGHKRKIQDSLIVIQ